MSDEELAGDLAHRAGELLVALRKELYGVPPEILRQEGDRRSAALIIADLTALRPYDAILVEDAVDDARRLTGARVWIVDPLDGTREFGEPGRDDWAVHVALWSDGRLEAGAVALPARAELFQTDRPPTVAARRPGPWRLAASRTRPPPILDEVARALEADIVPMGSAGAKAMAVVTGEVDAYIHGGGQYEWDSAAPVAVASAAGLHTSRLDGSGLVYNRSNAWLPDLIVCRPELADEILSVTAL